MFKKKKPIPLSKTYTKAVSRFETVPSDEIIKYLDNIHTHLGLLLSETRKSLTRDSSDEALELLVDIVDGTDIIRAAADVLCSRKE
jgi:hypothetical protein